MTRPLAVAVVVCLLAHGCGAPAAEGIRSRETASGVHYVDAGPRRSEALVLVHGWANDHRVWTEQVEALSVDRRVLAVDLPGHGASARGDAPWSMAMMARSIAEAMDHAGVDEAVLAGHSNGTPTVREFHRLFPGRTAGLVAVDGALLRIGDADDMEPFVEILRSDGVREFMADWIDEVMPEGTWYRERVIAMNGDVDQETLVGSFVASLDDDVWRRDPIDVPLLVVLADAPHWDEAYREGVEALAPDAEFHTLEGVSHYLFLDAPEEFTALLLDWLEREDL